MHDGLKRSYHLYVPALYDSKSPAPLVFGLPAAAEPAIPWCHGTAGIVSKDMDASEVIWDPPLADRMETHYLWLSIHYNTWYMAFGNFQFRNLF